MSIHLLVWALILGQPLEAPAPAQTGQAPVTRLIAQLGSKHFKEREAATQALDALGAPVLTALRQAAQAKDPEVRHRAEILAEQIQKRVETAQILEPKRVRLAWDDKSLGEAVDELAGQSGFAIRLPTSVRNRRITLDTGTTTFWEAFDQLCQRAGLGERVAPAEHTTEVRVWNARGGAAGQMVMIDRVSRGATPTVEEGFNLVATGEQSRLAPTYYAGAVRIRAMPATRKGLGLGQEETAVVFEVTPQPKLGWQGTTEVRIDRAVDELGQSLFPATTNHANYAEAVARRMGNGVMVIDAETGRTVASGREYPVRLKRADTPSRTLKEIKGAVTAQVRLPLEPFISVNDVFKATGQTIKGLEGMSLKVIEAGRQASGNLELKLRLEGPSEVIGLAGARRIMRRNRVMMRNGLINESGAAGDSLLALLDGKGQSLQMELTESNWHIDGTRVVQEIHAVSRRPSGEAEAVKFIYSSRRNLTIEVPFTLKDVPLP
jgi:hypothetical protein